MTIILVFYMIMTIAFRTIVKTQIDSNSQRIETKAKIAYLTLIFDQQKMNREANSFETLLSIVKDDVNELRSLLLERKRALDINMMIENGMTDDTHPNALVFNLTVSPTLPDMIPRNMMNLVMTFNYISWSPALNKVEALICRDTDVSVPPLAIRYRRLLKIREAMRAGYPNLPWCAPIDIIPGILRGPINALLGKHENSIIWLEWLRLLSPMQCWICLPVLTLCDAANNAEWQLVRPQLEGVRLRDLASTDNMNSMIIDFPPEIEARMLQTFSARAGRDLPQTTSVVGVRIPWLLIE